MRITRNYQLKSTQSCSEEMHINVNRPLFKKTANPMILLWSVIFFAAVFYFGLQILTYCMVTAAVSGIHASIAPVAVKYSSL